jgi:hypothetical protein
MDVQTIIKAMKVAKEVSYNNYVTPAGSFKTSNLMILTDMHKVSVFKKGQLVWSSTDEFDIRRIRCAR